MKPTEATNHIYGACGSQSRTVSSSRSRSHCAALHSRPLTGRSQDAQSSAVMLTRHAGAGSLFPPPPAWWGVWRTGWPDTHLELRAEMQWCGQWVTSSLKDTGSERRRGWIVVSSHGRNKDDAQLVWMSCQLVLELSLFSGGGGGGGLTFYQAHVWSCLNARQRPIDNALLTAPHTIKLSVVYYCLPVAFVWIALSWLTPI